MEPRLNHLTNKEIYIFLYLANIFSRLNGMSILDFLFYLKNNESPELKKIGKKFTNANHDYIIFNLFSLN